ncbi:MAG TPA: protein kinase [Kofleriaceae bacterium]
MAARQDLTVKPAESTAPEEFGPYVVYERLGVGGMATVHRAKKRGIAGFERGVALKRMLPHLAEDAEFINSFVREAKLASMLVHPNIAQIYDFGRVGSVYYIAMEHVDGFDVRKMLRYSNRHKEPLPLNVVMSVLCELCDALEYAHTFVDEHGQPQGIVHRDVSPSNLIVAQSGHLKVIDFGIAKANVRQLHTESGRVKGKLGYMSPEAVSGRAFGPVSDVFSTGVVAHELLTAHPLFSAKTDYDTLIRIHEAEISPPSRRNPSVPAALDDLVLAALARDPERRLQTAGAFRQGLEYVAEQAGIRFSARDVAEWRAKIATTEDPWGSRTSLPNVSSGSVSRAFPFPESSRNSLSTVSPRPQPPDMSLGRAPTMAEPRSNRGTGPLDPVSEDEKSVADLTWGPEAAPSSTLHPIPDQAAVPLPPPAAPAPPAMPMPMIGSTLLPQRRNSFARLALIVLFAIAAGLAVYQFVLRTPKRPAPVAPAPVASINFVVQPADAVVEVGGKEVGRKSPFEAQLGAGVYTIRAQREGYRPWTKEVSLREGEKQTVQVALEVGTAHLNLSSQPPGLVAQLDGKQLEQATPFEISIPAGPHVIEVTNAAGITWTQNFTADVDGKYSYVAPLTATKRTATSTPAPAPTARPAALAPPERDHTDRTKRPAPGTTRVSSKEPTPEPVAEPEPRAPEPKTELPPLPAPKQEVPAPAPEQPKPTKLPTAPPPAPKATPLVAPTAVTKLSGEIPAIKVEGVQDNYTDVVAKLCIDDRGAVSSAKIIKALPEITEELRRSLESWHYKPYTNASGQVTPACFPVTFRVVFKRSN